MFHLSWFSWETGLERLGRGGADLEEEGADFELAAKETPVELTTWLQGEGADFGEEGVLVEATSRSSSFQISFLLVTW